MKRLVGVSVLSAALICMNVTFAAAGCAYGPQTLAGSINGGQSDYGRFFTSSGGQITISISAHNGPLRVQIPGCSSRYGTYYICTTYAGNGDQVAPEIENPNSYTVTYSFRCHG